MTNLAKTTETNKTFVNLSNAVREQYKTRLNEFTDLLNTETEVKCILSHWRYTELFTPVTKKRVWEIEPLKAYLIERKIKAQNKELQKELTRIQTVFNAPELLEITISIEWKRSQMWGSNPNATASEHTTAGYNKYESGSISGCGYDKESTALANAVNQSNAFLKLMYFIKENEPTVKNNDLLGYGSGYGILPNLEGGVGTSCYIRIMEKLGYKFNKTASGKTFDVYTITKN
jgi:hypothetical protein